MAFGKASVRKPCLKLVKQGIENCEREESTFFIPRSRFFIQQFFRFYGGAKLILCCPEQRGRSRPGRKTWFLQENSAVHSMRTFMYGQRSQAFCSAVVTMPSRTLESSATRAWRAVLSSSLVTSLLPGAL